MTLGMLKLKSNLLYVNFVYVNMKIHSFVKSHYDLMLRGAHFQVERL